MTSERAVWGRPVSAAAASCRRPLAAAGPFFPLPALHSPSHRSYEEYVPLKKRRQMEEAERLAKLGRAPAPTSSADTGGGRSGGGTDSEAEVDHRHKESLLVLKAKQLQEVSSMSGVLGGCRIGVWLGWLQARLGAGALVPCRRLAASHSLLFARALLAEQLPAVAPLPCRCLPSRSRSGC